MSFDAVWIPLEDGGWHWVSTLFHHGPLSLKTNLRPALSLREGRTDLLLGKYWLSLCPLCLYNCILKENRQENRRDSVWTAASTRTVMEVKKTSFTLPGVPWSVQNRLRSCAGMCLHKLCDSPFQLGLLLTSSKDNWSNFLIQVQILATLRPRLCRYCLPTVFHQCKQTSY